MKNVQQTFERVHTKFIRNKEYFKKIIERLQQKKNLSKYNKLNQLLFDADKLDCELQSNLMMVTAEGQAGATVLCEKVATLKKMYRELYEVTKPWWRQWLEAIVIAVVLAYIIKTVIFGLYSLPSGSAEPTLLIGDKVWANKFVYFFKEPQRGELVIFDNAEYQYSNNKLVYLWQRYIGLPIPLLGIGWGPENVVKRIIAVPGDTIEGRVEEGKTVIYLNGKKLDEPYLNPYPLVRVRKMVGFIDAEKFGPFNVPNFLRWQPYPHVGTGLSYDPQKPFNEQPYYKLTDEELVRDPLSGGLALSYPRTPSYDITAFGSLRCVDEFGPITIPPGRYWGMGDNRKNSRDSRYWFFLDKKLIHGRASFVLLSIDSCESFWLFELLKHPLGFWTKKIRWDRFFKRLGQFNGRSDLQKS
jgi:signal peptidase I